MNITVYCGANFGKDPLFAEKARELGAWMARNGHRLVYGAGDVGMMGAVSNAVLENGGEVIGVTPDFFVMAEEIHAGLTDLRISKDMSERRAIMIEEGDAFIALPGGTGTLDEISEVMSLRRLGLLGERIRPVMLYNVNGYYDHLMAFFDRMADEEFFRKSDREAIYEVKSIDDIKRVLASAGETDTKRNTLYIKE